ncbi:uncharacterized protein J3D65DRAFT_636588 [Phyllosticta citribraziliensis]|uniref:Uncharacterized protein n=1 Tax=Phyllosticta citribraziliensis TaxID=989973 RepID=A0ABR1LAV3_9PEZI
MTISSHTGDRMMAAQSVCCSRLEERFYVFYRKSRFSSYMKPPQTVRLHLRHQGRDQTRLARLSLIKTDDEVSFISPNLMELSSLRPMESNEVRGPFTINGRKVYAQGYVDLTWSFENSSQTRATRFHIVQSENFPFDIALSDADAEKNDIAPD